MYTTFIGHFRLPAPKARENGFASETAPAEAYSGKGVGVFEKKTGILLKKHPGSDPSVALVWRTPSMRPYPGRPWPSLGPVWGPFGTRREVSVLGWEVVTAKWVVKTDEGCGRLKATGMRRLSGLSV